MRKRLAVSRTVGNQVFMAFYLEGLASVSVLLAQAARLRGTADGLREVLDAPVPTIIRRTYEQLRQQVQNQLGEEAFNILWDEGQAMAFEQMLAISTASSLCSPS